MGDEAIGARAGNRATARVAPTFLLPHLGNFAHAPTGIVAYTGARSFKDKVLSICMAAHRDRTKGISTMK